MLLEWNAEYCQENISLENTSVQILSWPLYTAKCFESILDRFKFENRPDDLASFIRKMIARS